MNSRRLTRLDAEIRVAASPSRAECLRCERAVGLACHGQLDAAAFELAALRQRLAASRPRPAIVAWLNLAEGLADASGVPDRDKIARAHALSVAAGVARLPALSAAWLAQCDADRQDVAGVARHAREALDTAAPDQHGASARAALAVAQAYDDAGRADLSRPWYALAHRHATAEGDSATLGAVLWQMAVARVAAWRARDAGAAAAARDAAAPPPGDPARHARASAQSAALFDRLAHLTTRRKLHPVLQAQVALLDGDTATALELLDLHLAAALEGGMAPSEGMLLADRGWCRLDAGHLDGARADAAAAGIALARPPDPGRRAPGHTRLARLHAALDQPGAAAQQAGLAAAAWAALRADQSLRAQSLVRQGLDAAAAGAAFLTCEPAPRRARA